MSATKLLAATTTAILLGLAPQVAVAQSMDLQEATYNLTSYSGSGCSRLPAQSQHDGVFQATYQDLLVINNGSTSERSSQCTLRITVRGASKLEIVANAKGILHKDNAVRFSMRTSGAAWANESTTVRSTGDPDQESDGTLRSQISGLNPNRTSTIEVSVSLQMQGREKTLASMLQGSELTILGS